jgi:hypothetical protein
MTFKEAYGIANGLDRLGGIVRDLNPKLFLESHHELNRVQAVRAQIIDEAGIFCHFIGFNAKMFDDDFFNAVRDIAHGFLTVSPKDQAPNLPSISTAYYNTATHRKWTAPKRVVAGSTEALGVEAFF